MGKLITAPKKRDLELALDAAVRIMMNLDKEFCLNFPVYDYMPAWERILVDKINQLDHETMKRVTDQLFKDPNQLEIKETQTHVNHAPAKPTTPAIPTIEETIDTIKKGRENRKRGPYKNRKR